MAHPEHEFHVVDHEITIDFAVPLPASGADEVLTGLLTHHAAEIIKDRKQRGQPLDDIPLARISARRRGEVVEVAVLDLDRPDEVLDIEIPEVVPIRLTTDYDPLAKFGERKITDKLSLSARRSDDELAPLGDEIRLTAGLAAGLRTMGIDPEEMSAAELGIGLLSIAGYNIRERGDGTWVASGQGSSTFVSVVEHDPGDYPELTEAAVNSFLIAKASARTDRGLLITPKYGPYLIYQKERANPDTLFLVRERLQDFVDSIAVS